MRRAKGLIINEEEMAGKAGLSLQKLQAYLEGEEPAPDRLGAKLKAAYGDLITAIRQDSYRSSLDATIRAIRSFGKEVGNSLRRVRWPGIWE